MLQGLELCESFVTIPDPLCYPPEALRADIHTVNEIRSPTDGTQDNGNGVMMANSNKNPPLRIILRDDVTSNSMPHQNYVAPLSNSP